jgi:SAM-dependent MidA family methyltransferase
VLVERSAAQRRLHAAAVRLEDPSLAFAPVDHDGEEPVAGSPVGPISVSLASLPRIAGPAVVVANELLDNLPFGLAEWRAGAWHEVRVDVAPVGGRLIERLVPLGEDRAALLDRVVPGGAVAEGARVPLQDAARSWLREALAAATPRGRVVAIDYAATTADLAARPPKEWLRTYRGHARGGGLLDDLGGQDVTCEVAVDQLAVVRSPDRDTPQADWLARWGLDALVEEARAEWQARAHVADLEALKARSRVTEADALTDPTGLGAFRVLEWGEGA